jgi:hypothetical protein
MTADVVVGIPTYNDASRIAEALQVIVSACDEFAGAASCVVVHADGMSTDGTAERAAELASATVPIVPVQYPLEGIDKLAGPYRGVPAKGNAARAVFEHARRLGVKACVVVDVDVEHFDRGWLDALVRPVLAHDVDFVAPAYRLRKFAGMINTGVAYPLTRALYGRRVRYPMGGDFACSMRFIDRTLADPEWDSEIARSMVDLWLTTRALTDGSRMAQAMLGAKRQVWREPGGDAAEPLAKVLAALASGAVRWQSVWQKVRRSETVAMSNESDAADESAPTVDIHQGIEAFRLGQRHLEEIWRLVLPPRSLLELKKLAHVPEEAFRVPDDVWARIVYDFVLAYHQRALGRDHTLSAFAPLFSAWVSSMVAEVAMASPAAFEERLEQLCLRFEDEKPYLISRWRWPDRFSP